MSTSINDRLGPGGLENVVILQEDTSGNTVLVGPEGNTIGGVNVAHATGVTATDTANILAAFVAAGNGGVVVFPPNQIYSVNLFKGLITNIPRLIVGNGSTLKMPAAVTTTTTAGYVQGTDTSISVSDSSAFAVGDPVVISDGAGKFTYSVFVTSKGAGTLGLAGALAAIGTAGTISSGAVVLRDDRALHLTWSASLDCEITGLVFDGNASNRPLGRQWSNQTGVYFESTIAYTPRAWVHNCVFKDMPTDAFEIQDFTYLKVTDNHFENVFGNGIHPGGSSAGTLDYVCQGNTFKNCYQATGGTTPTVAAYGHTTQFGPITTSVSPKRAVIANNICDTSTGVGFSVQGSDDTDIVLTGNIFSACDMGGFWVTNAARNVVITGNEILNCGHETPYISSKNEVTKVTAYTTGIPYVNISGNMFVNSVLNITGTNPDTNINGNVFVQDGQKNVSRTNVYETGLLVIENGGSTNTGLINVSGNMFRSDYTSYTTGQMDCINLASKMSGVNIAGNSFVGGWCGIFTSTAQDNLSIVGNTFKNQMNSNGSGLNTSVIKIASALMNNLSVKDNTIINDLTTTKVWSAILCSTGTTWANAVISGNNIYCTATPGNGDGTANGFNLASNVGAGLNIFGNHVSMKNGTQIAIAGGSLGSTAVVRANRWALGTVAVGTATTAFAADSNITG